MSNYMVKTYVPDAELERELNDGVNKGYVVANLFRNSPSTGGGGNTTIVFVRKEARCIVYPAGGAEYADGQKACDPIPEQAPWWWPVITCQNEK